MRQPFVSVLLPVYNAEATVSEAISSLLSQTYTNFEIIVIDDGSTDQSICEISKFKDDSRVKIISKSNEGLVSALNFGLSHCSGDLIARMDSDDISTPNRLAIQVDFLEKNQTIDVLGGAYIPFMQGERQLNTLQNVVHPTDPGVIHWMLKYYCVIAHPTVMFRKKVIDEGFRYMDVPAEDLDLWRRISNGTNISNVSDVLLYYRLHEASLSKVNSASIKKYFTLSSHSVEKPSFLLVLRELLKIRGINPGGVLWRWMND